LRLFSFGGYGLALEALALVVFGAIECQVEHATGMTIVPVIERTEFVLFSLRELITR